MAKRDSALATAIRRFLPRAIRRRGRRYRRLAKWPPIGRVRFGSLRRLTPISTTFGFDRGQPIDRYYITDFIRRHGGKHGDALGVIRGRVLEIGEDRYASRFADSGLERVDVLDPSGTNPRANVIADLADGREIVSDTYDCVICTQTLLLIYDINAAVRTLHRILKPGGTVLVTVPGISQICYPEMEVWGDYWRFTSLSARRLFEEAFEPRSVSVQAYGNVLASAAFLYGLSAEDLTRAELDVTDPRYELVVALKAVKAPA